MQAKLILFGEENRRSVFKVKKLPTVIGRGRDADLTLAHPLVSRHHCELYDVEGTLCVRDLGSLNGTYVGDFRVTEAALQSGDLLTIGSAKFEVVIGAEEEALMPPREPVAATPTPAPDEPVELEPVELEPVDDALSDIDFADFEPSEPKAVPTAPVAGESAPSPTAPKSVPMNKSVEVKKKTTQPAAPTKPAVASRPAAPAATPQAPIELPGGGESRLDLSELTGDESSGSASGDPGLNSFLHKLP